jgi:hypothetical protein
MKKISAPEKSKRKKKAILNELLPHLERNLDSKPSTNSTRNKIVTNHEN